MISIQNLNKSFSHFSVLKNISIQIASGQSVAILGPNGSGKTTLIKSILGLVIPDTGSIFINNVTNSDYIIKKQIAYLPQSIKFPENITVIELVNIIQDLRNQKASNFEQLIEIFSLKNILHRKIKNLSGGTKQKVNIVIALMFEEPSVLILDEPTVGLDPSSRIKLKQWLLDHKNNKTILLCTHILSDIEELCEYLIFILEGHIYYYGTIKNLLEIHNETKLENAIAKILSSTN